MSLADAAPQRKITSNIGRRRSAALGEGAPEYLAKRKELTRIAADIFKQKGYKATSFGDIAVHTGLDRATLYYYFGSKEEIFRNAVEGALERNLAGMREIMDDAAQGDIEKLQSLVRMFMHSYHENYPYLFVYLQQDLNTILDENSKWVQNVQDQVKLIEEAFATLIKRGIASGALRGDISVSLSLNAVFGMLNWTHRWYSPNGKSSPAAIADAFSKIFIEGMRCR